MSGSLFDEIIFGPVKSRRFGISLGINLLPLTSKLCSFDCIYCECGLTGHEKGSKPGLYILDQILTALESRLQGLKSNNVIPDAITFAGNGEPTMHPDFESIIDGVVVLRDKYFPDARITVLSNATLLNRAKVKDSLLKADNNVLKLDAGTNETFQAINRPVNHISLEEVVDRLIEFDGNLIIQTLFLRGMIEGKAVDNTLPEEVAEWLKLLVRIKPKNVMLYPIDRLTPYATLEKVSHDELQAIADQVIALGIPAQVF